MVEQWRGQGVAYALVAEAEKAAGSHQGGKLGAAVLYATHEPELTGFYAGLGFILSPDGIEATAHRRVQMEPMATPYGRQLVVRGTLPVPAR